MRLTVGMLKELLEDVDDDLEVRFAGQPSWPMEYSVSEPEEELVTTDEAVYLSEGSQLGYLPYDVGEVLGW